VPQSELGERLHALRKHQKPGLSRRELGERVGYEGDSAYQAVYEWETGRRQLQAEDMPKIARILGVTICELYGVEEGHGRPVTIALADQVLTMIDGLDEVDVTKVRELSEAVAALANTGGGTIVIGVERRGDIVALDEGTDRPTFIQAKSTSESAPSLRGAGFEPTRADKDAKAVLAAWPTMAEDERQEWLAFAEAIRREQPQGPQHPMTKE